MGQKCATQNNWRNQAYCSPIPMLTDNIPAKCDEAMRDKELERSYMSTFEDEETRQK